MHMHGYISKPEESCGNKGVPPYSLNSKAYCTIQHWSVMADNKSETAGRRANHGRGKIASATSKALAAWQSGQRWGAAADCPVGSASDAEVVAAAEAAGHGRGY